MEVSNSTTELPTGSTEKPKMRLVDIPINNQQDALQLLVTFINLAQKRGAFTIDESAKIWECIKSFQQ
jgi:hypothetical protein